MAAGRSARFGRILATVVFAVSGCMAWAEESAQQEASRPSSLLLPGNVGFFASAGVPRELVGKVSFALINAHSPEQIAASLEAAKGTPFRVNIDFGPVLQEPKAAIGLTYQDSRGEERTKAFAPLAGAKVKQLPEDARIRELLAPFFDVLRAYPDNVGTLFVADEPYLNGIPRAQMERAANVLRDKLDKRGLTSAKLGVIFASGMFDDDFATMLDRQAGEYVKGIDEYHASGEAPPEWVSTIREARLTTYDQAGNMYTGGGIPAGFDVVGFDFYVSTILLDRVHDQTLGWLAANADEPACVQFSGVTMTQVRDRLSFFNDGPLHEETHHHDADRALLDAVYQCRMRALVSMLKQTVGDRDAELLLIAESSNNGVLEFTADGSPKQGQPPLLVESRVIDEVRRAANFYDRQQFPAGLAFFTYEDDHDSSINLDVGGASGMPSVMSTITQYSKAGTLAPQ